MSAMLIGYVSDERYVALPDVLAGVHQRPRRVVGGAVAGVGVGPRRPAAGRVPRRPAEAGLRGEVQPRDAAGRRAAPVPAAVRRPARATPGRSGCGRGEQSEFRVHSVEPYKLELWRYGWEPEFVRGARLVRRARPAGDDADHARRRLHADRRRVEQGRLRELGPLAVRRRARSAAGCTTSTPTASGPAVRVPVDRRARRSRRRRSRCWPRTSPGTPTTTSAAAATTSTPTSCRRRRRSTSRLELKRYTDAGFFTWGADDYAPLSFDRPEPFNHIDFAERITDPIEGRQACHLAPAEWRLLGWLEREGFAYDFYAETQLHDGTLDLRRTACWCIARIPSTGRGGCTTASSGGSSRRAAG